MFGQVYNDSIPVLLSFLYSLTVSCSCPFSSCICLSLPAPSTSLISPLLPPSPSSPPPLPPSLPLPPTSSPPTPLLLVGNCKPLIVHMSTSVKLFIDLVSHYTCGISNVTNILHLTDQYVLPSLCSFRVVHTMRYFMCYWHILRALCII